MTITLTPELEEALQREAEKLGKTPQELAEETLRASFSHKASDDLEQQGLRVALEQLLAAADNVEAASPRRSQPRDAAQEALIAKFRIQGFEL